MVTPSRPKGKVTITKRRSTQPTTEILPRSPSMKRKQVYEQVKPKKKMIVTQDEEEEERTKSDKTNKLQVVKRIPPMNVDQVCEKLIES